MSVTFSDHWNQTLTKVPVPDLAASIREETINELLKTHHRIDADRYVWQQERTFVVNGIARTFKATMKADTPLRIDVLPFQLALPANAAWNDVETPSDLTRLAPPRAADSDPDPNIRLTCERVSLTLKWPKLDGSGTWTFTPPPLRVFATAYIALDQTPQQDSSVYQFKLRLQPLKIVIDPATMAEITPLVRRQLPGITGDELQALTDLLIIAMNIIAAEYAPKLVRDIEVPTPIVAKQKVVPCLLAVRDKIVTVGAAINLKTVSDTNATLASRLLGELDAAIERDIAAHGGLSRLVVKQPEQAAYAAEPEFYTAEEVLRSRMPQTSAVLERLRDLAAPLERRRVPAIEEIEAGAAAVAEGIAIGVDEYLLDRVVQAAVPAPTQGCTDWKDILDFVRGRSCHWARVFDADVTVSGTTLSGAASVDVGGSLEACVRKFWDCSWRWECGSLAIGVAGRPQVVFFLQTGGSGIAFRARINGNLQLVTNLPFPFDAVAKAFAAVIMALAEALINIFLAFVVFQIAVPEIEIPGQKTKIAFKQFQPFAFTRQTPASQYDAQKRFLAFKADVEPK